MALKIPDVSQLTWLDSLRSVFNGAGLVVRLFKNNYTPVAGSVIASFTSADFSGYTPGALGTLAAAATVGGKASSTAGTANTWTKSGATGNDIYGYYVTNAAGTVLYWAERGAGAPYSLNTNGEGLSVTPVITLASEF
jgi:hypothetical protein